MATADLSSALRELYTTETLNIRRRFETSSNGRRCATERAELVDRIACDLYRANINPEVTGPEGFCLVALGGYGRATLFPFSDIDLLFLCENGSVEQRYKQHIADMCRELWDMRLKLGPATRSLGECGKLNRENLEFTIALLDARFLCGDKDLFDRLKNKVLPQLVLRDRLEIARELTTLTWDRHKKYGDTIFHLEPNLKDSPGGLRDLNVAHWLATLSFVEKRREWPGPGPILPAPNDENCEAAFDFLASARSFLHYSQGRDDNILSYERQMEAATASVGIRPEQSMRSADWMRHYFRHARAVYQATSQFLHDVPLSHSALYSRFEQWRSRLSNADFSVSEGRVFLKQAASIHDPDLVLRLFEFIARHGLTLSGEVERHLHNSIAEIREKIASHPEIWGRFREILVLPHAAQALRAMHRIELLSAVLPEFEEINSLVVGDYYHRYTVDEHSFVAIEGVHALRKKASDELHGRYLEIFNELEKPELLFLALLLHDIGKASPGDNHVDGSLEAAERVFQRFRLEPADCDTVRFLIANHLEMSAMLMRRDIFDVETARMLAARVSTTEILKMLCVLTYADISAVNPDALTAWKAETLWQLYATTSNYLARSVDDDRIEHDARRAEQVRRIVPLLAKPLKPKMLTDFLEGLPRRYLSTHSPAEVAEHCRLASEMKRVSVKVLLQKKQHAFTLTVLTKDRAYVFATLTGILAAWGMNIVKAEAFSNHAGVALDTFHFTDMFRTFDLNASELERFKREIVDVLSREITSDTLAALGHRAKSKAAPRAKVHIDTQVWFSDAASSHSTIMELIARDRPGLLFDVSSCLSEMGCNIDVALIATEGQKAIDVFYVTRNGRKLSAGEQTELRRVLLQRR